MYTAYKNIHLENIIVVVCPLFHLLGNILSDMTAEQKRERGGKIMGSNGWKFFPRQVQHTQGKFFISRRGKKYKNLYFISARVLMAGRKQKRRKIKYKLY